MFQRRPRLGPALPFMLLPRTSSSMIDEFREDDNHYFVVAAA